MPLRGTTKVKTPDSSSSGPIRPLSNLNLLNLGDLLPPPLITMHTIIQRNLSSIDTAECHPLAEWLKLCLRDLEAIVGLIFFMWYVIWGVPVTIRIYRWCKIKINSFRNESLAKDIEKGYNFSQARSQRGRSSRNFLRRTQRPRNGSHLTSKSEPVGSPSFVFPEIAREKVDMDEYDRVVTRLSVFRFPAPATSSSSSCPENSHRALRARSCTLPLQHSPCPGTPAPSVPLSNSAPQLPPCYPITVSTEPPARLSPRSAKPDLHSIPTSLFRANFENGTSQNCLSPPPAYAHFSATNGSPAGSQASDKEARDKD